jgi:hypothetical protein
MSGGIQPESDALKSLKVKCEAFVAVVIDPEMQCRIHEQYGKGGGNVTLKRALLSQLRALVGVLEREEETAILHITNRIGEFSGCSLHPDAA